MIRHGEPPYVECSTRGDTRFSAFCAKLRCYPGKSIEDLYQGMKKFADGRTGLTWKEVKGLKPENCEEVNKYYSWLWDQYIYENPELLEVLKNASGLSDMFGQEGHCCQATELWRIRNERS